jgi:hypothetical protein
MWLQHAFESEGEVDSLLGSVQASQGRLRWAALRRPKRVIIWSTPYKQLYKDPSLVVRVKEVVKPIHELPGVDGIPDGTVARVKAGIGDADRRARQPSRPPRTRNLVAKRTGAHFPLAYRGQRVYHGLGNRGET